MRDGERVQLWNHQQELDKLTAEVHTTPGLNNLVSQPIGVVKKNADEDEFRALLLAAINLKKQVDKLARENLILWGEWKARAEA